MILGRYLTKEMGMSFLAVMLVLILVSISNQFVSILTKSATGMYPHGIIFKLLLLNIPELLTVVLPLAFFLGIILALGKLYADNEITVIHALGFSNSFLLKKIMSFAIIIALVVGVLTISILPKVNLMKEELLANHQSHMILNDLAAGKFYLLPQSNSVFYVEKLRNTQPEFEEVFIAEQPEIHQAIPVNVWDVVKAKFGSVRHTSTKQNYIELYEGNRYQGRPGGKDYQVAQFKTYGKYLPFTKPKVPTLRRTTTTKTLFNSKALGDRAELHWRLALPISVIILAIFALPLSKLKPRQGRFAKFFPAILVFMLYMNLLSVAKRGLGRGIYPHELGLWWLHILFLLFGVWYYWRQLGHANKMHAR